MMNTTRSSFWSNGSIPLIEPEILSSIIGVASDIALVVSGEGIILSVLINRNDTSFGNLDHWEGRPVQDFLTIESIPKFNAVHEDYKNGKPPARAVELNHCDNANWEFPIRYSFHPFGNEHALLMLGRDLRPIAETQQQLVQAQMSLEQGYESRREFDARYRLLLRIVRDAVVFVSVSDGRIKDANDPAAALLGTTRDELIGATFNQEFRDRKREEFIEGLVGASFSEASTGIEVQTRRNRQKVILNPNVFRAGGERILICRITAADDVAAKHDELAANLSVLFDKGADAVLFTSITGVIKACNDSFLDLIDAAHVVDIKGRNLSEFLGRGQIDMSVLIENARRSGQMRMYSTKLMNDYGSKTAIEMSATYLNDRPEPELGFVIRDGSRVDAMRKQPLQGSEDSSRNVMELVGSATLKEIVTETTDVIEKMCIETAVNLTRNNRVAAAEMLGLSRQSLYVKLRKYGLLSKDIDSDA